MERGLDGSRWDVDVERDGLDRVIQEVEQHDDFTLSAGQAGERDADVDRPGDVAAQVAVLGRRAPREALASAPLRTSPAEPVTRDVERHDAYPRAEHIDRPPPRYP